MYVQLPQRQLSVLKIVLLNVLFFREALFNPSHFFRRRHSLTAIITSIPSLAYQTKCCNASMIQKGSPVNLAPQFSPKFSATLSSLASSTKISSMAFVCSHKSFISSVQQGRHKRLINTTQFQNGNLSLERCSICLLVGSFNLLNHHCDGSHLQ